MTTDTQASYTKTSAALRVQPWRVLDPDEPRHSAFVYSLHVDDPTREAGRARVATVELVALRARASAATWLMWTDIADGVTPEHTSWDVVNIERPFDTRRENGAATDVLLAFVMPTLHAYLSRAVPHLATPSVQEVRAAFSGALTAWHITVRRD
jgi:hypothetical protein